MSKRSAPTTTLETDWQQASRFYTLIHDGRPTEFRFINGRGKVVGLWGDLTDAAEADPGHRALQQMTRLNSDGYGAYMVINTPDPAAGAAKFNTKGAKGNITDADITGATALFVDLDRPEKREGDNLALLEEAEVPPSLIVQSSYPNKVHGYWLVADLGDMDLWERLQVQLIAKFGGDRSCRNPSRIMRIPGFWHTKGEPIRTRILQASGQVYTVAEILEFFELDPDYELYTEVPRGADADDWVPPPGFAQRLMNVATQRAKRVTATDKGRHNALLWFAMRCRENNLPKDDALTLAVKFADMLPARETGPIPHKEATDAIDWVYFTGAGRNPPMRDKTTVITERSDDDAPARNDFDPTASHTRAPITIQDGGYAHITEKVIKNEVVATYRQLTNWTFTPTLALKYPDGTTGHRGELVINSAQAHEIDLPAKAWSGRRELLAHIAGHNAAIFTNSAAEIALIHQFILTTYQGLPVATGVQTYGLHHHQGEWIALYEDTLNPHVFYSGTPVDPNSPAYRAHKPGTKAQLEQARDTIRALPTLVTPEAALALLGYGMAAAYSPRITKHLGDRLPFLYITGERESGKSSSIELVLALTTGHPSARLRKAPGMTNYQYDVSYSNLNDRLAALDEYRPGSIDDAQLRKHHDLGAKYRGSGIAAKDHAYILNSPLIVAGEGFTEDAAALSRGPLYFIQKKHRGDTDKYLRIQNAPNHTYAHHLAHTARTLPEPEHQARLERAWAHAKQATDTRGGPRLQFALAYIAYGLLHLQEDVDQDAFSDPIIRRCLELGVTQTLDGGTESKTNLEMFLEQLGSAAAEHKEPAAILVPGAIAGTVIVRISPAVELVKRRYGKDAAISNPRMLRQYAEGLTWVDTGAAHRAADDTVVRGLKVNHEAAPDRCDLGALQYLDNVLRSSRK